MKITKYLQTILLCLTIAAGFSSCSNYLDVSDELAGVLTKEEVFENASFTRRWHRYIYTGIPDNSFIVISPSGGSVSGLGNPWTATSDELKAVYNNVSGIPISGYNASNASLSRWHLYQQIRQANIFMKDAHVIPQIGDTDFIDQKELDQLLAEARFFRAYYHFLLLELYGPIPIMTELADPASQVLDFERNTLDEVINFIDKELKEVSELLNETEPEQRLAVPTRGTALAIRAKLWVYAASPLFNGGYNEALALTSPSGKKLFPTKNDEKWTKAKETMEEFLSYAQGKYELHKEYTNGVFDPHESLYQLFQEQTKEVIWASTNNSWGSINGEGTDRRISPRSESQGFASIGVVQELVDDFFMADGLSIKESPLYSETGFSPYGEEQDMISNMYVNREPRFYQAIFFQGRRWQVSNRQVFFQKGSSNDNGSADNPRTGYLLYKRMNRTLFNQGTHPRSRFRPTILYRLAEFYLLYAEVLNEINPNDNRIIQYVDLVRERAGIPGLAQIKPQILGNKEMQRQAIRHEMRIELCTEGQRYFDVRRWMIAESEEGRQGGEFHGMDMNSEDPNEGFHKRVVFERRVFERRMYLYPIPLNEIQKSKKLVQNPGWE